MLRLTKATDYGIVLLTHMAGSDGRQLNVCELAEMSNLPAPMTQKILKILAREGLLISQRGAAGGYRLARAPETITVLDMINALEGPVALTECTSGETSSCAISGECPVSAQWEPINVAVRGALRDVTLAQLARSPRQARAQSASIGAAVAGQQ